MGRLERIWIKRAKQGPMDVHEKATLEVDKGLTGNANQGGFRQVTLITQERWAETMQALGGAEVDPSSRRANLFLSGIDLTETRGRTLRIGACRLKINGETKPCGLMDQMHQGLKDALKPDWRGGAFGEVLDGGEITTGDDVEWEAPAQPTADS